MAASVVRRALNCKNTIVARALSSQNRHVGGITTAAHSETEGPSSSFTFSSDKDDSIHIKAPSSGHRETSSSSSSVTMPMSFMTGSIVGKRFYKQVTTRKADDGNGWTVMLDYRTLKTPSKKPLKLPTLFLAKAIAAEWEYQVFYFILTLIFYSLAVFSFEFFGLF